MDREEKLKKKPKRRGVYLIPKELSFNISITLQNNPIQMEKVEEKFKKCLHKGKGVNKEVTKTCQNILKARLIKSLA